ncbi:MAG: response regulator transcription factor [Candidatus Omnitrophica bacterium]|jgi:DNA-binding response OmpR family regulator|nr:response regulator transcription factor [Candidatus Omnitrophota bacterium]MDD3987961.1 response regulator transcription factor [Candidatus Omnitrophota bacterium]MDD4982310.1 response regulator transcription factor [Candidatus Omnitrophota bacterium]
MRILLVEDETRMASFIERGLKEEDYVVDIANDGEKALFQAEINPYDLIILDIMLPVKDGITVCRELRIKKINTPILMLTSKDRVKDKVLGLNAGADDYLSKPFAFEELLARASALLRRDKADKTGILKISDLEIDQLRHKVIRAGNEIKLTSKEFALLEYLMLNATHVVTRTMISEHVWHEDFDSLTNVIDVYMNFLRNKIDKGHKKQLIHTVFGKGYVLKE